MATLYVSQPGAQVCKADECLVVRKGDEVLDQIPIIKVDQVVLMGRGVSLTTTALHTLTRRGVDVVYLTGSGRFVSRVVGMEHKHSRLRHQQALASSDPRVALGVASSLVHGKVLNQRVLVQRHSERQSWAQRALDGIEAMAQRVDKARDLDELRGLEGQAAREYFGIFRRLLAPPKEGSSWGFERRAYYPPPDPVNALLSFAYSLLLRDIVTACELIGLDPYLGFFHAIDYGRPSMALDLEEEFRPAVADSLVLEAINRPFVTLADFEQVDLVEAESEKEVADPRRADTRGIYLAETGRMSIITLYENRVNQTVVHGPSGDRTTYRQIFQAQAQQMARVILGETQRYVPFSIR
jgi:CRISPR-associated protein Cas1